MATQKELGSAHRPFGRSAYVFRANDDPSVVSDPLMTIHGDWYAPSLLPALAISLDSQHGPLSIHLHFCGLKRVKNGFPATGSPSSATICLPSVSCGAASPRSSVLFPTSFIFLHLFTFVGLVITRHIRTDGFRARWKPHLAAHRLDIVSPSDLCADRRCTCPRTVGQSRRR